MEMRNPETEAIDQRPLSQKLEEEGNAPEIEETKQGKEDQESESSEEESGIKPEVMAEGEERAEGISSLMQSLTDFEVRTIEDLYKIKKMICKAEGGR